MARQRWKVPISIFAVNHIEVIYHIVWLHIEINIYGGGFEPLISSCWFFKRNSILLFLNLIYQCAEMNRWLFLHQKMGNLKMLASSLRCQMKKSSCSFNMVKLTVNQQCCLIDMLVARIRIHDNIDPNWVTEVRKWSVTITICSFPYIGKSKELDYTRKSAHEVISGSNHPSWYRANQYGQYHLLQKWKWVHFTFEAP